MFVPSMIDNGVTDELKKIKTTSKMKAIKITVKNAPKDIVKVMNSFAKLTKVHGKNEYFAIRKFDSDDVCVDMFNENQNLLAQRGLLNNGVSQELIDL